MKKLFFNLIFYPLMISVTVIMPAILLLPMLAYRAIVGSPKTERMLRRLIILYGHIVVKILAFPFVNIEYKDLGTGQKQAACIYVCNHRSFSDAFLMVNLNTEAVQVVNLWPFHIPILGAIAKLAGYLSINAMPFEEFVSRASQRLREGVSVVVFPEGTRTGSREVRTFNGAAFRLAQQARCPIVPVCITGNENIPPRGSYLLNPGTIKMRKLPALEWEQFKDESPFHLKNRVRDMIQVETDLMEASC